MPAAPATQADTTTVGRAMYALVEELFPIFRSITGPGVRATLAILRKHIPLIVHEVPTGTKVLDWVVPREWRFRAAYIHDADGRKILDAADCNLHVVNYSAPVDVELSWSELTKHLHTLPAHPEWIPYRTSYDDDQWGFCLSHRQFCELARLGDRKYRVRIDATLENGALSYGELSLPGRVEDEVVISTHVCHPSLANDNLSGIVVATYLARELQAWAERHYSYRFLFLPATIGALTWLGVNEHRLERVKHGLVLSLLGDAGGPTYKKSRRGNTAIDRAVMHVLRHHEGGGTVRDFTPIGYDERQYCSPGFNLPIGCLMRTPNGEYPEYHSSADNVGFVRPEALEDSLQICLSVLGVLEHNQAYLNRKPKGEPRLGPLGLYSAYGTAESRLRMQHAVLWVLNLSDGEHELLDIAERANLPFTLVRDAAALLRQHSLLEPARSRMAHHEEHTV